MPWRITSSDASLVVYLSEDRIALPTRVDFVGQFAGNFAKSKSGRADAPVPISIPSFEETPPPATAPFHLVRIVFGRGHWVKLFPSVSETHVVPHEDYDWSAFPAMRPGEVLHEALARRRKQWLKTGISPNPGMYEVKDSPWLASTGLAAQAQWKHYLLTGCDGGVEVLAQGWEWRLGPPVPEW